MTQPILIFPHVPKTGGTTLLNHFNEHMGSDAILKSGRANRMRRYLDNQPQKEEGDAASRRNARLIQGHGVDETAIRFADDKPIRLMIVLRHPVSLTRSRFNQRSKAMERRSSRITTQNFMANHGSNFMTRMLIDKFPTFADPDKTTDLDKALSILKKFDYVLTTESLDATAGGLLEFLDIPTTMERKRVAETKTPLDATDDEIRAINADDLGLFEAVETPSPSPDGRHNPLGFDADGQARAIAAVRASFDIDVKQERMIAYQELAGMLAAELHAEAAIAELEDTGEVALERPDLFLPILKAAWDDKKPSLSEQALEKSAYRLKRYAMRKRRAQKNANR